MCAWDVCYILFCHLLHIRSGKTGICFHYYCAVYDEYKYSDTFWLAGRTRLFVQYTISLSSLCKLIWRHWTYKMPVRYILSSVWVRLSIFSPLSIIQYVGLYVFSLPIFLVMIERIYILCLIIITKSEVWTITHCLGLGHETMVSTVCLSMFLHECMTFYFYLLFLHFRCVNEIKRSPLLHYTNLDRSRGCQEDTTGIPIINPRRSSDRLMFIMGILIPVIRSVVLVNTGPGC